MKFKSFLLLAALPILTLIGCQKPVDLGEPKVVSNTEVINATAEGGEFTVEIEATIDWELKGYSTEVQEWLNVSPESGKASADKQVITITVLANQGASRSASIEFYGNVLAKASLTVNQEGSIASGDGSKENPFSVSAALEVIAGLAQDVESPEYYVSGIVSNVKEIEVAKFGNATYSISDDGTANNELLIYRSYALGGEKFKTADQVKVGDKVIVVGKLINFKGNTPEVTQGGKLYSLNGKIDEGGSGSETGGNEKPSEYTTEKPTPTKVSIEEFLSKSVNYTDWYELTGEIVSLDAANKYGNFTIKDATGQVYIYGMTSKWVGNKNDQSFLDLGLKIGDIVTLGTLRQENPYGGEAQGGGNWMAAYYISHEAGSDPEEYPAESITLTFPDENKANNALTSKQYETEWEAKIGSNTWKLYAFNNNNWNNWTFVRCGRKNLESTATITTVTPMPKLSAIEIYAGRYKPEKVKSIAISVYSDAALTAKVGEDINPEGTPAVGVIKFNIPTASQQANLYYKLTIDCDADSGNGFVEISKVVYVASK